MDRPEGRAPTLSITPGLRISNPPTLSNFTSPRKRLTNPRPAPIIPRTTERPDVETATLPVEFRRTQSAPLVGTASAASALLRVRYSHDAMIDHLIENPGISQGELAAMFGYTGAWISRVINSDAFLARLAERKSDLVDPSIALTLDEKFRSLAAQSLDVIQEKLSLTKNVDTAMKALELSAKALGYGARQQNLNVQQNFVVTTALDVRL